MLGLPAAANPTLEVQIASILSGVPYMAHSDVECPPSLFSCFRCATDSTAQRGHALYHFAQVSPDPLE